MEQKIQLSEKIELFMKYAKEFFEEQNNIEKIYTILINREDLLKQLDNTPDSFWEEVKKQKMLYVYTDSFKWRYGETEKDRIIAKYQNFNGIKGSFPVLVYEKQMEDIFRSRKNMY